ncbi:glyoxylate reductase/hydroxypyruvate reductase isoform X1 [Schistocerca cancellata]|uniref:glyoxylate reductase/hydroxypyruvate reductase isoform X1 n=1 Tax=Schistocerca cancellata TaxID=274614 RepID=UPI00211899FD|nr:glyoxylate reductase/hydroxypyruvate reductase isoform X1 [Schistocerca cancellata]XP_049775433.1 glyoxylate reductase/hydroxypyruvate reductase isoform X1 [Schistocerca cancellata]XP_049775434.1 glyoxylate reductase/hydroxypyruvate reductase isoform X1 [Schistocerca cancellata]XP_049775435.1 glyoxylate reductase/hydroxypyruvate reductase isoform X1 [Schistocerca cancellata]XP_049775436.1 glyoxylate reductase/hydroxypyruvate reductase isoform X1 [Schistocerca cancellata]
MIYQNLWKQWSSCGKIIFRKPKSLQQSHFISQATGMGRFKVYVTHPNVPQSAIQLLQESCDVTVWQQECPVKRAELMTQIKGKDALFCLLTDKIDKEVLDSAGPDLKVIGTMSVGYDHIDVHEVKKRGIKIGYTPDVLTDAVADLTIALLLATSRRLFESHNEILKGQWGPWSPLWMCGPALKDSTIGMVGYGRIGRATARRLVAFGVGRTLYWGRSDHGDPDNIGAKFCPELTNLLAESDFVIVTCALTTDTHEMFDEKAFAVMKPSAVFINTSRGGVVKQDALIKALETKQIWAAGLDVTTPEPLSPDHPLLSLRNCVVIPHIGSATTQARTEMAMLTARNILAALNGEPLPAEIK